MAFFSPLELCDRSWQGDGSGGGGFPSGSDNMVFFFCATGSQQWLLGLSLSIVEVFSSVFVALHDEYECGLLVRPEG